MRFFITRHGQPAIAENTQFPAGDPPLTTLGRQQAQCLGKRLERMGFKGKILSSPYNRTAETTDVICSVLNSTFFTEAIIREHTIPEAMVNFKGLTLEQIKRIYSHLDNNSKLQHPWWAVNPDKKETSDEVTTRVKPLLENLSKGDEDILLVGHGASTQGCVRALLDVSTLKDLKARMPPDLNWNCALTVIEAASTQAKVVLMRDTEHLPRRMVTSNKITLEEHKKSFGFDSLEDRVVT